MLVPAVLLLLVALAGLFPVGPHAVSPRLLFPVWFPSWLAQSFAQPLIVIAVVVAAIGWRSPVAVAAALAAVVGFVVLERRNRAAGRRLLQAVGAASHILPFAGLFRSPPARGG